MWNNGGDCTNLCPSYHEFVRPLWLQGLEIDFKMCLFYIIKLYLEFLKRLLCPADGTGGDTIIVIIIIINSLFKQYVFFWLNHNLLLAGFKIMFCQDHPALGYVVGDSYFWFDSRGLA